MRCVVIVGLAALLAGMSGCGEGERPARQEATVDTTTAVVDTVAAASGMQLKTEGFERQHAEAGFQVYWPSGCGKISEKSSNGATERAAQEFIYTCDRDGAPGRGVLVRCLRQAHDADGFAANPRTVVAMIERQLRKTGVQTQRQRPLKADGIEGVEVQATEPEGAGQVWIRGFLVGGDIYILEAWNQAGGLFEDPEVTDFFWSFQTGAG